LFQGHYNYGQYSAQVRNRGESLSSLEKAVLAKPIYFYWAQAEKNFNPIRREVKDLVISTSLTKNLRKDYYTGMFDLSTYCVERNDAHTCVKLLRQLILKDPSFYYMSQNETLLNPVSQDVKELLLQIRSEASETAKTKVSDCERQMTLLIKVDEFL
jgi:hypothetical protein